MTQAPITPGEARALIQSLKAQGRISFGRVGVPTDAGDEDKVSLKDILEWVPGTEYLVRTPNPRKTQIRLSTAARRAGVKLKTSIRPDAVSCLRIE